MTSVSGIRVTARQNTTSGLGGDGVEDCCVIFSTTARLPLMKDGAVDSDHVEKVFN
jgi:hypothetical protein